MACAKRDKIDTTSVVLSTQAHKSPRSILSAVGDKTSEVILDINLNHIM